MRNRYMQMLVDETRKPIEALKLTLVFSVRFLALLFLRVILWSVFFLLPVIVLFLFVFHTMTNQLKSAWPVRMGPSKLTLQSASQERSGLSNSFNFETVDEDLRFWLRELERFRS